MNRIGPGGTGRSGLTSDWKRSTSSPVSRNRTAAISTIRSVAADNPVVSRSSAMKWPVGPSSSVIALPRAAHSTVRRCLRGRTLTHDANWSLPNLSVLVEPLIVTCR